MEGRREKGRGKIGDREGNLSEWTVDHVGMFDNV